jgi:2-oxoglutarate dehydrogenase E1 component
VTLGRRAGAEEVVIGMAHRGRLSVLAHNLGRSVESILAEFEGAKALEQVKTIAAIPHAGTGDVKYHYGAEGMFTTRDGDQIKVRLYPNPSHLEFVDPVVTGGARAARPQLRTPSAQARAGGAAAAPRYGLPRPGIVAETLNLQSLAGYSTSSTVHIITDNRLASRPTPRMHAPPTRAISPRASTFRSST